jgi:hypothetical protein
VSQLRILAIPFNFHDVVLEAGGFVLVNDAAFQRAGLVAEILNSALFGLAGSGVDVRECSVCDLYAPLLKDGIFEAFNHFLEVCEVGKI